MQLGSPARSACLGIIAFSSSNSHDADKVNVMPSVLSWTWVLHQGYQIEV